VRAADSKHHRYGGKRQVVAARDASRRSCRSGKIISNSQPWGEYAAAKISDGEERDEHTTASSRRDRGCGGHRAQKSHGKQRDGEGVGAFCPEDCSAARTDGG
jgi:hypothetical protein